MGSEQKNAFLAISLSALILFGWQYYFAPQKPVSAPIEPTMTTQAEKAGIEQSKPAAGPIEPVKVVNETYQISRGEVTATFSSDLTFTNFVNPQAAFSFAETVGSDRPLRVEFDFGQGFKAVNLQKIEDNRFHDSQYELTVITSMNEQGVLNFSATSAKPFRYRFTFASESKRLENGQIRYFSVYSDSLKHFDVGDEDTLDKAVNWMGIDYNYHLFTVFFDKEVTLLTKNKTDSTLSVFTNKSENALNFNVVYVKKDYDYLATLGSKLQNAVDFGWFGMFAVWILKGLQFFFSWIPNYGISIILLTFVIRMITFPLQYKSIVSMKKLQVIQPELTKLREKFKDDPQRMQKESMDLFKRSGANPLGGCLPLLLQMPIFFAFYKVLNHAVELVGAPFYFWLHDLSNKDPYYILPVLMTLAMFLQQKMTPNTITDPIQKKMMLFMPLIFGFIMKDLPSGLSLYILVSTVLGILQQVFVFNAMNKKNEVVVVK